MTAHILHIHGSFDLGGKEARTVRLMNLFGGAARHTIVSIDPDRLSARAAIGAQVRYEIAQDPPPLSGRPSVGRYEAIARYLRRFDLVLSHGWEAIDAVMARRTFARGMPPIIHHEDGFTGDEAVRLRSDRNLYRRIALSAAHALVVPSRTLEAIARGAWGQPAGRVHRIVTGIPLAPYQAPADPGAIPGFRRAKGEVVIGAVARLEEAKDLPRLVRAAGGVSVPVRLVIVGDGPERAAIEATARAMAMADRVHLPGALPQPHRFLGLFDIFALSSQREQFPVAVVEAMAAGLPIVAPALGDLADMVAAENRPLIPEARGELPLRNALEALALSLYDESTMARGFAALYDGALRQGSVLTAALD